MTSLPAISRSPREVVRPEDGIRSVVIVREVVLQGSVEDDRRPNQDDVDGEGDPPAHPLPPPPLQVPEDAHAHQHARDGPAQVSHVPRLRMRKVREERERRESSWQGFRFYLIPFRSFFLSSSIYFYLDILLL